MLQPSVPAWFEIPAQDLDRASRFYESVLDAKLTREDQGRCGWPCFRTPSRTRPARW